MTEEAKINYKMWQSPLTVVVDLLVVKVLECSTFKSEMKEISSQL